MKQLVCFLFLSNTPLPHIHPPPIDPLPITPRPLPFPRLFCNSYRKAVEAKRGLEEAFGAMDADDGTPPVGVPLKNPKTKTLKGGLKIKDT